MFDITFHDVTGKKARSPHTRRYSWPATLVKSIQYCSCRKSPDRWQILWLSHVMEFLGSIETLMKGSGLEDLFAKMNAENSGTHMISGKAIARATRAHILTQSALMSLLMQEIKEQSNNIIDFEDLRWFQRYMNMHTVEKWMNSHSKNWFYLTVSNKLRMKLVCLRGLHQCWIFYGKCSICLQLQVTLLTPRVPNCICNKRASFHKLICRYTTNLWMVTLLRNEQRGTGLASGQILRLNERWCNP